MWFGGFDGVPDLVQEALGLGGGLVEGDGDDAEELRRGHLEELEPRVKDDGQNAVDQGEVGASPGVEADSFLPVAATSLLEVFFPMDLAGRCEHGDQLVPLLLRDAGQGWLRQSAAA